MFLMKFNLNLNLLVLYYLFPILVITKVFHIIISLIPINPMVTIINLVHSKVIKYLIIIPMINTKKIPIK